MSELCHAVTASCRATPDAAFAFLADPESVGSWALGCWGATAQGDGLVRGRSLFDAGDTYVRAYADRDALTVDFGVGDEPGTLVRRISARVVPGDELGYADRCLVTLVAWRPASMSDERWTRLTSSHAAEILLLRARIEESA